VKGKSEKGGTSEKGGKRRGKVRNWAMGKRLWVIGKAFTAGNISPIVEK